MPKLIIFKSNIASVFLKDKLGSRSISLTFHVVIPERLELILDALSETIGGLDDFANDLSATIVLCLLDALRESGPLAVSALGDHAILYTSLRFNLFNELSDDFIDSILVIIKNDLESSANGLRNVLNAILLQKSLLVILNLGNEVLPFLIELLFEFDAKVDEL